MTFEEFIAERAARLSHGVLTTDDVLASFLPLLQATIDAHRAAMAAPLEGVRELRVENERLDFEDGKRKPLRFKPLELARLAMAEDSSVEKASEVIGVRGAPLTRRVYLPGYVAWEHQIGCHDPLSDAFCLGLILASVACGLNLNDPADLARFVEHRRNLFVLHPRLHPVLAQTIGKLTRLDRRQRPQDLNEVLSLLENYREARVELEVDLARYPGFHTRDRQTRNEIVLSKLKERLFDLTRRNNLLHFRPTMQSVNLTHASIPLLFDPRHLREDRILVWSEELQKQLAESKAIPLARHLNFAEAIYLPSLLDRIIAEARRDYQEYGFAQLRLVACFLSWTNLKEAPVERYTSPLVLIPVRLSKTRGLRDTYSLEGLSSEAEINPVIRHQFKRLYNIDLPESIDLAEANLDELFDLLSVKILASEPAIELHKIDRPPIELVHERARRRLDQYRRSARLSGQDANSPPNLDSVLPANPKPPDKDNPYEWSFDLCSLTVTNLRYRRMSLVRDYEAILDGQLASASFETAFSLAPRPVEGAPTSAPPLEDRYDVVPCDPTQVASIAEARRGASYIIQGPPGTGKSQTITNLIADFVARGKRVLFVCEKRAAIDVVFARLKQCGLTSLCSLIHDSQTDKREFILDLKQAYEAGMARQSQPAPVKAGARKSAEPVSQRAALLAAMNKDLAPLAAFDETMLRAGELGLSWRKFLDRHIRMKSQQPQLSPDEERCLPSFRDWHFSREILASVAGLLADFAPEGALGRHPLRRLRPELTFVERPADVVRETAPRAARALEALAKALAESGAPSECWQTLARAEELLAYAKAAEPLATHGNLALVESSSPRAKDWQRWQTTLEALRRSLDEALLATANWREKLPPAELSGALERARRWQGSVFARLSPAWWRLRKALRECYDFRSHRLPPSWVHVLEELEREYAAHAALEKARGEVRAAFGGTLEVEALAQAVGGLRERKASLSESLKRLHTALVDSPQAEAIVEKLLAAQQFAAQCRGELAAILVDYETLPLADLSDELAAIAEAADEAPQALAVLAEMRSLPAAVSGAIRRLPWPLPAIEAAICHRTWEEATRGNRPLQRFDGRLKADCAERLSVRYRQWLEANATEIREGVLRRFQEHVRLSTLPVSQLSPDELEFKKSYQQGRRLLEHEFGKSMRFKSIRELVDGDAGGVIRDLKPVWLMSPLSVSDTLPLASDLFDVVIFDEASQATLEESVPTLFRGPQTIVVGDEMQLPPTDFFAAKSAVEDDELDERTVEGEIVRELSSDSLLNHAARNLPSTMLGWHYRSRGESLISFSNWAFYDGRLLTVPDCLSSEAVVANDDGALLSGADKLLSRPITFHHLPESVYENRRNRDEADQIALIVRDLLTRELGLSIGVIAFSEAQQSEIEAALTRLADEDDDFRRRLEDETQREVDGQFVGLLVKNLENIQGDERDVILLSVCYGPNAEGKMLMSFGPINKTGGEKRLNVAFTRAKRHMAVVSGIRHSQITSEFNEGANCLRNYLRYAEALSDGDAEGAERVLSSIARWQEAASASEISDDDATAEQLAEALRERGFLVERSLGHSHFRVDLAVRCPGDRQHRLGVLIDTPLQYEQSEPLERDVMRPQLLREFGWRVESVLAKDWCEHRDRELARILAALS